MSDKMHMNILCKLIINKKRGFMLIELLLAFAIVSVMATSLYVTFAQGVKLDRNTQHLEDVFRDARWAIEEITNDLEHMVDFEIPREGDFVHEILVKEATSGNVEIETGEIGVGKKASFFGEKDTLSFISRSGGKLKSIRYLIKDPEQIMIYRDEVSRKSTSSAQGIVNREKKEVPIGYLVKEEIVISAENEEEPFYKKETQVLSTLVLKDSLVFSYAKRDPSLQEKSIVWQEEWSETSAPVCVRVQFSLRNNSDKNAPVKFKKDIYLPVVLLKAAGFFLDV